MPQAFPVSLNDFFRGLKFVSTSFDISTNQTNEETGGGEVLAIQRGARLWEGTIGLPIMDTQTADEIIAQVSILDQPSASFFFSHPYRKGPHFDPDGSIIAGASPTISAVSPDMREININNLPTGYELQRGDLISFEYGTPSRYALHYIYDNGTATAGTISNLEVSPPIRNGFVAGAAAVLSNPICKAKMVPGSLQRSDRLPDNSSGITFNWRQTLR